MPNANPKKQIPVTRYVFPGITGPFPYFAGVWRSRKDLRDRCKDYWDKQLRHETSAEFLASFHGRKVLPSTGLAPSLLIEGERGIATGDAVLRGEIWERLSVSQQHHVFLSWIPRYLALTEGLESQTLTGEDQKLFDFVNVTCLDVPSLESS